MFTPAVPAGLMVIVPDRLGVSGCVGSGIGSGAGSRQAVRDRVMIRAMTPKRRDLVTRIFRGGNKEETLTLCMVFSFAMLIVIITPTADVGSILRLRGGCKGGDTPSA